MTRHPSDDFNMARFNVDQYERERQKYQDAQAQAQWYRLKRGRALGWIFLACLAVFCWLCGFGCAALTLLGI